MPVRGGTESSGGQRSTHSGFADVHKHAWQPTGPAQRIHDLAPRGSTLGADQVFTQGFEAIEVHRIDHETAVREALSSLRMTSAADGQPRPVARCISH